MRFRRPLVELGSGQSRRDFIKYSVALGALLGLDRWKVFESTARVGGVALADEMACAPTNRSLHIIAGDGGFAWFNLLWPHVDMALAKNPQFAFHAPDEAVTAMGTDKPLVLGPEAPWQSLGGRYHVSAFMSGTNQTHTRAPASSSTLGTNVGLFAACASLQTANPTLVPVISVNAGPAMMPYQNAPGAPQVVQVGNSDGLVDLFNSAASSAMGALSNPKDAALFDAHYKGFLGLSSAAGRATYTRGFRTSKTAASLLGVNLSSKLRPSPDDLTRYGVGGGGVPNKLMEIAKGLITTSKAFQLGLTSCVLLPAMNDDPHPAFADMAQLRMTTRALGKMLDAFIGDLRQVDDPSCAGTKMADNVVISVHGDTPKNPLQRSAWPDGTPGNTNWAYALGAGWLKSGWFGGVMRDGSFKGFDPSTGKEVNGQPSSVTSAPASAAIAYAVAKGDMRRVSDFYRGPDISGIVRPKQM